MAAEPITFFKTSKGALGEREDWWRLLTEDSGAQIVEHEWAHENPYKTGTSNNGTRKISIDDFLESDASEQAKIALRKLLNRQAQ